MVPLRLVTVQAGNTIEISRLLANWLAENGPVPIRFEHADDWRETYRQIRAGSVELAWICGRPYIEMVDQPEPPIELLVAPVMAGQRYGNRPVYFSDVVVRADSGFQKFADLRGASWAYNESGSQSGYHITTHHLATLGETSAFFGRIVEAGSHEASVAAVLDGTVDAAAIDSTVLSWLSERDPSLGGRLRIIATLGPSPIPPLVVATTVERALQEQLRALLTSMHETRSGQAVLRVGGLRRLSAVDDAAYDPIRRMAAAARHIALLVDDTG